MPAMLESAGQAQDQFWVAAGSPGRFWRRHIAGLGRKLLALIPAPPKGGARTSAAVRASPACAAIMGGVRPMKPGRGRTPAKGAFSWARPRGSPGFRSRGESVINNRRLEAVDALHRRDLSPAGGRASLDALLADRPAVPSCRLDSLGFNKGIRVDGGNDPGGQKTWRICGGASPPADPTIRGDHPRLTGGRA